jgi:hypothetical protein
MKKLFGVSDMHPDVRPLDVHRQTVEARAMMQQGGTTESQIKAIVEAWADAVRRHDLSGILAHHEQDIVMFDVPPPLQSRGMDEYKKTWDLFFRYHKPSQAFDIEELAIDRPIPDRPGRYMLFVPSAAKTALCS